MVDFSARKVIFKDNEGNYVVPVIDPNDVGNYTMLVDKSVTPNTSMGLGSVTKHSNASWDTTTEVEDDDLPLVPFTATPIDYTKSETVTANTAYVFTTTGIFVSNTAAFSTLVINSNLPNKVTIYASWFPIDSGVTFTSSLAGKFYYYEA